MNGGHSDPDDFSLDLVDNMIGIVYAIYHHLEERAANGSLAQPTRVSEHRRLTGLENRVTIEREREGGRGMGEGVGQKGEGKKREERGLGSKRGRVEGKVVRSGSKGRMEANQLEERVERGEWRGQDGGALRDGEVITTEGIAENGGRHAGLTD